MKATNHYRLWVLRLTGLLVTFTFSSFSVVAKAQSPALQQDGNKWTTIHLNYRLDDDWKVGLGLHNRVGDNFSNIRRNRARLLAARKFGDKLLLTAAFDRIENYNGRSHEDRSFLQLEYALPSFGKMELGLRNRLEQRWISSVSGTLHRNRTMLSGTYPLSDDGKWYAVSWHELFLLLNGQENWPQSTFDQYRFFGGAGYRFNTKSRVEVGYQMRYHRFDTPNPNRINHILFWQFFHDF